MKNKKILFIFFIVFFTNLFFVNKVFASSFSISDEKRNTIENVMKEHPDCNSWISVDYQNKSSFFIFNVPEGTELYAKDNLINTCDSSRIFWYCYYYNSTDNTYTLFWSGNSCGHQELNLETFYSNRVVYADENKENVFFSPTLPGIVARQVEEVEMSQVLQEIITLLPQILVVMVSLVGLRKGLKMLETFLHQS